MDEPDLWYKPMTDVDGFECYSYILVYVDNILLIMKYPKDDMAQIQESFTVKTSSIKEPKSYLGADKIEYITVMDPLYGQWYLRHNSPMP